MKAREAAKNKTDPKQIKAVFFMRGDMPDYMGSNKLEKVLEAASAVMEDYDPSGSYTGRPVDEEEKPVQDADDL